MVEVVGQYTDLKKAGANFSGRCPFHEERTPSFSVNAGEKLYYCFGCGAGGNLIGFVMAQGEPRLPRRRRVPRRQVRHRAGVRRVERPRRRGAPPPRAAAGRADQATDYFERVLQEARAAAPAREYLARRGLTDDVCRAFNVGFSQPGWDKLRDAARRAVQRAGPPRRRPRDPRQGRPPLRPLPRPHHVPARRRARAHARLRRAHARRRAAQVPQLAGDAALPQERGALRPRQGQGRRPPGRSGVRGRGLHRRAGARPGRRRQRGREHGNGAHRSSSWGVSR